MPLSTPVKWLLACVAGAFVLFVCLVIGTVYWFRQNGDRIVKDQQAAIREGQRFGGTHRQPECTSEALRRRSSCSGIWCMTNTQTFFAQCLKASAPDEATCADVPPKEELLKGAFWSQRWCVQVGHRGEQGCVQLAEELRLYCQGSRGQETPSTEAPNP